MTPKCIINIFCGSLNVVSCTVIALLLLSGCTGSDGMPDSSGASEEFRGNDKDFITLDLSVGIENGTIPATRTFIQPEPPFEDPVTDYEKVRTLRVVIVRANGVIEHNRMVMVNEGYSNNLITGYNVLNDNLQFKVIPDEMKTIYLFANEDAVNLNKPSGVEFNLRTDLEVGGTFPEEEVQNLLIIRKPNTPFIDNGVTSLVKEKKYIPMSEFFNVQIPATTGKAEDYYYKTLFLTRSLIKFSFSISYIKGDLTDDEWAEIKNLDMKLMGVKITNLANSSYYLPRDTEYDPPKYPGTDKFLTSESAPSTDNNIAGREITRFEVPANAGASDCTFWFDQPIQIKRQLLDENGQLVIDATNNVSPAIYLPESKTENGYFVSLIFDNETEEALSGVYNPKELQIKDIPRNTHVKINMFMNLRSRELDATVTLFPYTGVYLNPSFGFGVPVESVHITEETAEVAEGQSISLVGYVLPTDANNKDIIWTSSDDAIAAVEDDGLVKGIMAGEVVITATSADDSDKKATCKVKVNQKISVTSLSISPTTWRANIGETVNLTAEVSPEDATNQSLNWTSSNESVATVSSSGTITAKSEGTAVITATSIDNSNLKATCAVTVNPKVMVQTVTISQANQSIVQGNQFTYTATVSPTNATDQDINWTSSNPSVATVSSYGLVTAITPGTTTITATAADGSGKYATRTVTVTRKTAVTSISLNFTSWTGTAGGNRSTRLTATVSPSNATNKNVTWTSSNPSVASINDRYIYPISEGTATIYATSVDNPSISASCTVTVRAKINVNSITISQSTLTLKKGQTYENLTATVLPSNASYKNVIWTSSNSSVASVELESGIIEAESEGTTIITVTPVDNPSLTASCIVTVTD